ncbi:MAG: hypothetical protein CYG60_21970 [Actinobacteria bacterium]|nr:MAG: hypothetical protein CYG60_21970 [Actinomycetota bacterium]
MGGVGSGNRYRFDKKTTTGETQSLDVRYLHREGLLESCHSFSLRWSRAGRETGSIGGRVEGNPGDLPEGVVLSYRHRGGAGREWEDVRETVPLEWTPCNFGGERPWFLCPGVGCGWRAAVLYGPGRYFLCRYCYDLSYESQRENGTHRSLRRAQKIRERLGGNPNMTEPFPERPKGMHHDTYTRLWRKHHEAEMEQLAGMRAWLDKLEEKIE